MVEVRRRGGGRDARWRTHSSVGRKNIRFVYGFIQKDRLLMCNERSLRMSMNVKLIEIDMDIALISYTSSSDMPFCSSVRLTKRKCKVYVHSFQP